MAYDEDDDNQTQDDLESEIDGVAVPASVPAMAPQAAGFHPPMALPASLTSTAPQAAPRLPPSPGGPGGLSNQDLLRMLAETQKTSEENKAIARIGGAFSNLGTSLARANPSASNQQAFEGMAQDADAPLKAMKDQISTQSAQNKLLQAYLLKNGQQQMVKSIADQKSKDYNARTQAMNSGGNAGPDPEHLAKADSELGTKRTTIVSRGANKSYAEAVRRGQNIQSLLHQYPNLNTMPQAQVNTLTDEISGLVNGGAPTLAGSHGANSTTWQSDFNKLMSKTGGAPKGADLGAFISQYAPYVKDIVSNSKKHLYKQNLNLVNSYKGRLSPDAYARHLQEIKEDYSDDPLSSSLTYSDPEKEKRYQEFRASQGLTKTKTASAQ